MGPFFIAGKDLQTGENAFPASKLGLLAGCILRRRAGGGILGPR